MWSQMVMRNRRVQPLPWCADEYLRGRFSHTLAFESDAKPDMKYTLLFIDLFSPAWTSLFAQMGATMPLGWAPPDSNHHWSVYNMNGQDVMPDRQSVDFLPSANAFSVPNQYVSFVRTQRRR